MHFGTSSFECPNAEDAEKGIFDNDDDMGQDPPPREQPQGAAEAAELAATRWLVPFSLLTREDTIGQASCKF